MNEINKEILEKLMRRKIGSCDFEMEELATSEKIDLDSPEEGAEISKFN